MPAEPLTLSEREEIRVGLEHGELFAVIGARLGRHRSTIAAEVGRNGGRAAYTAAAAQQRAVASRARVTVPTFVRSPGLAAHVQERLEAKDSPMTISIELKRGVFPDVEGRVSHEAIYAAIHAHGGRGLAKGLHKHLHRRRRCRKHRLAPGTQQPAKKGPLGLFNPISARPPEAEARSEVGHLEGDLIIGAHSKTAIVTVFDRCTRHVWLADFPEDHGADAMLAAMAEILGRIPEHLHRTLTYDQGREMACHAELAELFGIDIFFADPHAPWQRPTNENGNGLLRRYVGKGTDLGVYTPEDLRLIEYRINTMPRRSLNWDTAHNRYAAAVAMTG